MDARTFLVFTLAACATAVDDDPPVATCGEFVARTHVILVTSTPLWKRYWCPAPRDPGLTLPQYQQQPDGRVELLAYTSPGHGERHGVYGFRGGRPELNVDELCEWVDIPIASCSLE